MSIEKTIFENVVLGIAFIPMGYFIYVIITNQTKTFPPILALIVFFSCMITFFIIIRKEERENKERDMMRHPWRYSREEIQKQFHLEETPPTFFEWVEEKRNEENE